MTSEVTGIVLTAGIGSRLKEETRDRPKGLLEVGGHPLLHHNIRFLRAAGAHRIVVVAGFFAEKVRAYLAAHEPKVVVAENPEYLKGNLLSVVEGLRQTPGSFLLSNADHLYRPGVAEAVRRQSHGITAFCDFDRTLGDDDMKVLLDEERRVTRISKTLTEWTGGYVGLTYCDLRARDAYNDALSAVRNSVGESAVAEHVLQELATRGKLVETGDISGYGWNEIDVLSELKAARRLFK